MRKKNIIGEKTKYIAKTLKKQVELIMNDSKNLFHI